MILVIKGADFSANNIGKVEITTELAEVTMEVMQNLTKYSAEKRNRYARALDTMLKKLVSNDLWNSISMLSIPVMSASMDECSYDVIGKFYAANVGKIYGLNEDNEMYWLGNNTGYENKAFFPVNITSDNMCLFGAMNVHDNTYGQVLGLGDSSGWFASKGGITFTKPEGLILGGNTNVKLSEDRVGNTSAFVGNFTGTSVCYIDKKGTLSGVISSNTVKSYNQLYPALSSYDSGSSFSFKVFGCGVGLTTDKAEKLYRILQDFADVFEL